MKLLNGLKVGLGLVAGILIPGASPTTTDTTHQIQQHLAEIYGPAILAAVEAAMAETGVPGLAKAGRIVEQVVADILGKGVKADPAVLRAVVLDIVNAAYRAAKPTIGGDIVALADAFHAGPALTEVATLAAPVVQAAVDAAG